MRRGVAGLIAAAVLLATLTGCGILTDPYRNQPSDGGVPSSEAIADLEAIPGVANAGFRLDPWDNPGEGGLFSSSGVDFVILFEIESGFRIPDPRAFLDEAMRTAWSINDGFSPKGQVQFRLDGGTDVDHDWEADILELFATDSVTIGREDRVDGIVFALADDVLRDRYGAWPAAPEPFDASLVDEGAIVSVDPAAVWDFGFSGITGGGQDCWSFHFTLGVSESGERYPGDVTVTLHAPGQDDVERVAAGSRRDPEDEGDGVQFCYGDRRPGDFGTVSFAVESEPVDGFRTVDVEGFRNR